MTYFSERRPCFATRLGTRLYLRREMRSKSAGRLGDRRGRVTWGGGVFLPPPRLLVFRIIFGPAEPSSSGFFTLGRVALPDVAVPILLSRSLLCCRRARAPSCPADLTLTPPSHRFNCLRDGRMRDFEVASAAGCVEEASKHSDALCLSATVSSRSPKIKKKKVRFILL